ncbi:MAG: hypothetical protein K2X47_14805 [Bdellovibrionales bacterium]|nr:hypothetical protein [Bdellovibrionales bacterium]
MKRIAHIVFCGLVASQVTGCGQDPYRDQPDNVKNARGPLGKVGEPPVTPDDLVMDSSSPRYNFTESKPGTVQLVAKALRPGTEFSVFIENLDSFPGAAFDAKTLIFTWTPPIGFIRVGKMMDMNLQATMVTNKSEGTVRMSRSLFVPLSVSKFEPVPEIVSVEGFGEELVYSGETRTFTVNVRDPSASESSEGMPRVKLVPQPNMAFGIAHYIGAQSSPTRDPADPTIWHVPMKLDLSSITNSRAAIEYNFGILVQSQSGKISKEFPFKIKVVNKVSSPKVSFSSSEYFVIAIGKTSQVSFSAFDANGDGAVSVEIKGMEALPGVSSSTCKNTADHFVLCSISWNPDPAQAAGKAFKVPVQVTNTPSWAPNPVVETYDLELRVEAASVTGLIEAPRERKRP